MQQHLMEKATGVDTSNFVKKAQSVSLKLVVDELDIYQLKTVSTDFSQLSNGAQNDVIKKS